ncbi:hypothetical protein CRYUN_Cryun22dG0055500 [Craigia yunnanensis]
MMMKYIIAIGVPVKFDPVPIEDGIDFHFILNFAIDVDPSGNAQNGKFSPYWLWISNAFSYLKSMLEEYLLDGIDIDYENFPKYNSTFSYCIGELITRLKNQSVISIATIVPFHTTTILYFELFENYGDVIDFVNYQFYDDKFRKPKGYLEAFKLRAGQLDKDKLLPSYEINGRGIRGDAIFDASSLLEKHGFTVNGVMIFSDDASSTNKISC